MSINVLFGTFIVLGIALTVIAFNFRSIVLTLAAFCAWLTLAIWVFTGGVPGFDMGQTWMQAFGFVLVLMGFAPLIQWISQLGKQKVTFAANDGKGGTKTTTMWANPNKKLSPREAAQERQSAYSAQLKGISRRVRSRR